MDQKDIADQPLPRRPDYGSQGKEIRLRANFFEILSFPHENLYHFDIEFDPEVSPFRRQREVFTRIVDENKEEFDGLMPVYDGRKNMYLAELPDWQEKELECQFGQKTQKMLIRKVGEASMEALRAFISGENTVRPIDSIQALDIALRQYPTEQLQSVGRSFYTGLDPKPISDGCEVWIGYQQSVRPAQGKLVLNVDISATAFITPQSVIELANSVLRRPIEEMLKNGERLGNKDIQQITRKLKNLRVEVRHMNNNRSFSVNSIIRESATEKTFESETGVLNVAEYFSQKYNINLRFPELPLLHIGSKKKDICLPMELAFVCSGQRLTRKLTPRQTSDMIKITAQKPHVRMSSINSGLHALVDSKDPYARHFGIQISKNMMETTGRILQPPTILYAKSSREASIRPRGGQWQIRNSQFYRPASLDRWGIIVMDSKKYMPDRMVGAFVNTFGQVAEEVGVEIRERRPPLLYANARRDGEIEAVIERACREISNKFGGPPQLLVFILPRQDSAVYGEIKRVCDTVVDVPSQCMLSKHIKKKSPMYVKNVLLKVNVKLGGCNSILEKNKVSQFFLSQPAILFGADVTHPAPRSALPSIAAVVGSMDAFGYRYATSIRAQNSREEIILDLTAMIRELLIGFYRSTKMKPEKILFYRDGVSEGQFAHVRDFEITAVRQACQTLEDGYAPPITFVVVQKRHHLRLFPQKKDADKSGNVPAGTVVDRDITHPFEFDFYLNSHAGLQGTSRPCHYHVLWDENEFTADILQNFTNRLCYSYARCTKSVSIVPPAYYAHLVAYRGRFHARGDIYADDDSVASGESTRSEIEFAQVLPRTRNVMYFM